MRNYKTNPKKEKLKSIALDTVSIIDKGEYVTHDGKEIYIGYDVKLMVDNSHIFYLPRKLNFAILNKRMPRGLDIRFSKRTTYQSLVDYKKEFDSVFVLNFASAKNPGGGFLHGSSAQEESLARVSGLFKCLVNQKGFYEKSRKNDNNGLYYNQAIYSPSVPFIRDCNKEETLVEPVYADVITCAAVNRGIAINKVSEDLIKLEMVNRIKTVVELFIRQSNPSKKNVLILGAFGCGVFKNNPSDVAKAFNYVFDLYKNELLDVDLIIDFSISDDSNYYEFKRWI